MNKLNMHDRFWDKVEKTETCWHWVGTKDTGGYGMFLVNGKIRRAHRVVIEIAGAELIPGLVVDHLCGNRACVNPEHLEQVTQAENMRRMNTSSVKGPTWTVGPKGEDGLTVCGTPGAYRRGCRCDTCRAHQAARVKDYRRRKATQMAA